MEVKHNRKMALCSLQSVTKIRRGVNKWFIFTKQLGGYKDSDKMKKLKVM